MAATPEMLNTRPIRLLEIIGNAVIGGMETYVLRLIKSLAQDDALAFIVTCICPFESPYTAQLREAGCEVFITPIRDDPVWQSIQFTTQLIRSQRIDVVHAHLPNAHVLAAVCGRLAQVPVLATVHGMFVPPLEVEASRIAASHLSVVSQSAYMQALTAGIAPERLTLIGNGVDTQQFSPRARQSEWRIALGIPAQAPVIGFAGRLAFEKGPDLFVRMAWFARKSLPDTHFVMVGEGPMQSEVQQLAASLGLSDSLHLAGARSDMAEMYSEFDVLVSSSRSEGMPLVLLEAMACGLPVVAFDVGGIAEIVESSRTGLLARSNDYEGLAHMLVEIVNAPKKMQAMGSAARQRAEQKFALSKGMKRMAQLLAALKNAQTPSTVATPRHRGNVSELSSAPLKKQTSA